RRTPPRNRARHAHRQAGEVGERADRPESQRCGAAVRRAVRLYLSVSSAVTFALPITFANGLSHAFALAIGNRFRHAIPNNSPNAGAIPHFRPFSLSVSDSSPDSRPDS